MATGVFHTATSGQSLKYAARRRRERGLARFAEELANNPGTLRDVAGALGISYSGAQANLARIRRDLGIPARDPELPPWQWPTESISPESVESGGNRGTVERRARGEA